MMGWRIGMMGLVDLEWAGRTRHDGPWRTRHDGPWRTRNDGPQGMIGAGGPAGMMGPQASAPADYGIMQAGFRLPTRLPRMQ